MDQEQKDRLLNAKNNQSIPGTLNESGTGIGIVIVNDFMKENNASYSISSQLEEGTTFILHLPKGKPIQFDKNRETEDVKKLPTNKLES